MQDFATYFANNGPHYGAYRNRIVSDFRGKNQYLPDLPGNHPWMPITTTRACGAAPPVETFAVFLQEHVRRTMRP